MNLLFLLLQGAGDAVEAAVIAAAVDFANALKSSPSSC